MSENPSRLTTLLNQLTALSIEEQERLAEVHRRHQHNVQLREATFREHRAELEQQHQAEVEHDNTVLTASRERIVSDFQTRRRALIVDVQTEEDRTAAAAAVVPDNTSGDEESSRDASGFLDAEEVVRDENGRVEIIYNIPVLPANASSIPPVLAIGSAVWVLNPLKLARVQKRSHLKGIVLSRGKANGRRTVYTIQVYNPFTHDQEQHRRQRQNLAPRQEHHEYTPARTTARSS